MSLSVSVDMYTEQLLCFSYMTKFINYTCTTQSDYLANVIFNSLQIGMSNKGIEVLSPKSKMNIS